MKYIILLIIIPIFLMAEVFDRSADSAIVKNQSTKLEWTDSKKLDMREYDWEDGVRYCNILIYDEKDDWRLPNINELYSLIDDSNKKSYLNQGFLFGEKRSMWSSTTDITDDGLAFVIDFKSGKVVLVPKNSKRHIKCVRGIALNSNTEKAKELNLTILSSNTIATSGDNYPTTYYLEGYHDGDEIKKIIYMEKNIEIPIKISGNRLYFSQMLPIDPAQKEINLVILDKQNITSKYKIILKYDKETKVKNESNINRHALIIGVQNYKDYTIPTLDYPHYDATNFMNILQKIYSFRKENIYLLTDATYSDIKKSLAEIKSTLKAKDELIVFFAGHAYWDEKQDEGYWLLSDSRKRGRGNWFSNSELLDSLASVPAKNIVVVADACFSGSLLSEKNSDSNAGKKQSKNVAILTSGNLKEVPDDSIFFEFLIEELQTSKDNKISLQKLHKNISPFQP